VAGSLTARGRWAAFPPLLALLAGGACRTEIVRFGSRDAAVPVVMDAALGPTVVDASLPLLDGADRPSHLDAEATTISRATSGYARYVRYTCCDSENATNCVEALLGGPTDCADGAFWTQESSLTCEGGGGLLFDYVLYVDCTLSTASDAGR
jgi:hypothetical protein